ncbi:acyl-CoA thioesterase [Aureibacter tunicatorum]|uniref:Uncharacterized protein (TIGR00369 family) n=1 Tax=Aureibacter tunicatorum TaxID=866807 RepID=A0AAE3XP24_9BACT|nr:acyl-CoA thioesterase [Aureibacter tunicatorum]MDR6239430.1 uncharacterized protein (TIGR00369 family) [Aureibacter tunicatorum]BDD04647.1 acyl-CoA thioesterase [Aureibacter tunicatorum]
MNKFRKIEDSQIEITQLMLPSHANFSGKIHGGHLLSMMDQVAFASASKHSGRYCVTASVDRVEFLTPIEVGELVSLKAQVNFVGRTSMVVGIRVESENIQTGEKKHCNSSYFTMVAKDENGKSCPVPGLIIEKADDVRRFLRSANRIASMKNRKTTFKAAQGINFMAEEYLKELEAFNVQLDL